MSFLLDTNAVSEWVKARPDPGVVRWLAETGEDRVFISVVTLAEFRYGIERLPARSRRQRLEEWLQQDVPRRFEGRVLPGDEAVADTWGKVMARSEAAGRPLGAMDALIVASAEACGLTLVTRNVSDFAAVAKGMVNPWTRG